MNAPVWAHHWLKRFVGEWEFESRCSPGPGQPDLVSIGRERVRMLGDLWLIGESTAEIPAAHGGGSMDAVITIGFDPAKAPGGRFVGTWVGSPMTSMFVYEGELEGGQHGPCRVLPLRTIGPSFTDPAKLTDYIDVVELLDDSTRLLWSKTRGDDGQWHKFMEARYRRTK